MRDLLKILLYAKNLWPYYLIITVMSVLLALSNQVVPFVIKAVADLVTAAIQHHNPDYALAIWLAVALFASDVAGTLFSNWGGYYGDVMAAKLKKQLSERYYDHLLKLPQRYYDNELTGTIINRLNRTIAELSNFMNFFSNNFFQMILTMIFTLVVVAYYSWEVALLLFIVYPLFLWLTGITSKQWQAQQKEKNLNTDIASGRFAEAVSQIRVVKSFNQESRELRHLRHHYQKTVDITYDQSKQWHKMDIARRLALNLIFFIIMAFIFWQTLQGRFTVGEMFLLIQFASLMRIPLFSMSFIVDQTQRAIAGSRDYFEVMELVPSIADKPHATSLEVSKGRIEYKNVNFGYNEDDTVLHKVSFDVAPGTKVALVGESGEGKSTIASLLMRLYEPNSGKITVDGTDIADVTQRSLRDAIAVVFQEPAPFSGTVSENIAYSRPEASPQAIEAAARAANAHDFISDLPSGYQTEIGERGVRLSGGQKQRLAIARAILKDAPILILDEATSSLDSRAEAQVQQALDALMENRTTLIIAHRLSTIAGVDKIITIKGGSVDEVGTPAKLAKTKGIYAELLELQLGVTSAAKEKLKEFDMVSE
jgi:ATP-binding cassette, subfamily B, bacterial